MRRACLAALCGFAVALPAMAVERQVVRGHVPAAALSLQAMNRLPASERLHLAIGLPLRNQAQLTALLQDLYDPASPSYRHYLTPQQFAELFGPSQQDYQAVVNFANASGLRVTATSPNRVILDVEGAAGDVQKALHVSFHVYQHPTEFRTFYAPDAEPSLDLSVPILHIKGLNNFFLPKPRIKRLPPGAAPIWARGSVRALAAPTWATTSVPPIFQAPPSPEPTRPWASSSLTATSPVTLRHTKPRPACRVSPCRTCCWTGSMACRVSATGRSASTSRCASRWRRGSRKSLSMKLLTATPTPTLTYSIKWPLTTRPARLSSSWGIPDNPISDQIYLQFIAQGQSFFQASGDGDSFYIGTPDYSDNPYITLVGGTTLSTTGPGGAYVSETVWNWGGGEGSGGGISTNYAIPSWQQGINMTTNAGSTTMRNVPDVALTADNIWIISDNGVGSMVGGTSAASPLWAAFTALVNEQALVNGDKPVGFLNPALYAIGSSRTYYPIALRDVTTGNNTNLVNTNLFYACPGYDLCTGWGTPNGTNLVNILAPAYGTVPLLRYLTNYISGGNGNGIIQTNECDNLSIVLTNFGNVAATGVRATLATATPGVIVVQPTASYGVMLTNTAATNQVPLRISTAPTFPCGTPIDFTLTINSDQALSPVTFRFRITSGVPAIPLRYDNFSVIPIPDVGQIDSPIVISNFPSAVTKAVVSLFITHQYDADLRLELIGPDGTTTTLSANNGGSGQNYGLGLSDAARTTFDDDASLAITTGFAPFVGTFRPQQPLAFFIGKAGTNVNGTWKLRVIDQYLYGVGTLQCWSLFLTPATCLNGGGECPGADMAVAMTAVPDPVILGDLLTYTIYATNNGPSSVKNAAITLQLPSGVQFVDASTAQGSWSVGNGVVTFALGPMAGRSNPARMTVVCQAIAAGDFTSTATVSADQPDFNPANNTLTLLTRVRPPTADLAVSLSAFPSAPLVGGTLTYTVTAVNNGPSLATGVGVTNVLPNNSALISFAVSQGAAAVNGDQVFWSIGTLTNSASATATIAVTILSEGVALDSASIFGNQYDPVISNNTSNLQTIVGPAADLSVSVIPSANPVVLGSSLTYLIIVSNAGPSAASSVLLTHSMDASLELISVTNSQGTVALTGNNIVASLGSLAAGGSAQVGVQVIATIQGPARATTSVVGAQADPDPSNNSVTTVVRVAPPFISFVPAGAVLLGESFSPPDGAIDNGETVTVGLRVRNAGNVSNTNLQATLLAVDGITPVAPNGPQDYGILFPDGSFVEQPFSFIATGAPGATVTAVLQLQDGDDVLTNVVSFNFTLPTIVSFTNTDAIAILDFGGSPYPSTITVSGMTGTLSKVTATLQGFSHTYPRDVDALLAAPTGANTLLMSHAGNQPALNLNLTFDDAAPSAMPRFGSLISGPYRPTEYTPAPAFSNPAPAGPYAAVLSSLNGINPNGVWSLYVMDDQLGDTGGISNGWSLTLTTVMPVNPLADLALIALAPPSPAAVSDTLAYLFILTNGGPSDASDVVFTNALPPNASFLSASCSQGTIGFNGDSIIGNLGVITAGSTATVSVAFAPNPAAGFLTNTASVGSPEIDLNPANNVAVSVTQLVLPQADLVVSQDFAPNPAVVGYPLTNTVATTNNGPGVAIEVSLTDLLPTNALFLSATATAGSWTTNNGVLTAALGNLAPNAGASLALVMVPLAAVPLSSGLSTNVPLTSVPVVATVSFDPDLSNNSVTNALTVNNPAPLLLSAGALLVAGSGPGIAPGQMVTVSLVLTNAGTADTAPNLTATLLDSGGVIPATNAQSVYGTIVHGGASVVRPFTFTATSLGSAPFTNGGSITATLLLREVRSYDDAVQATNFYTNSFVFILPDRSTWASPDSIHIPYASPASPYPSTLTVSNLTGVVSKVTVNFFGLSHTFPSEINALLVSPAGNSALFMSHAGSHFSITNITLFFDDAGAAPLPADSAILDGTTYQPTAYNAPSSLPLPAPPGPYASPLAGLNGSDPNGTWSLYILADQVGDSGFLNGWGLSLTTVSPLNVPTVVTAAPSLSIQPSANGQYLLSVAGAPGKTYVIQASSDLSSWTAVSTNTAAAGAPIALPINVQSASQAFYRAVVVP